MVKKQALVPQSDSLKKKKLKLNVDKITCVKDDRKKEMNDKKTKMRKRKPDDEVCVPVENTTEEPQDTEQLEDTHKQEYHTQKKKKRKNKDSESDLVTSQEEETERAEKKQKKRKKSTAESSGDAITSAQQTPPGVEEENGLDGEEDLSPEEKRVLERKLKKILNKEEKKKLKEEGKSVEPEKSKTNIAEKQALEFLTCWAEKREEWKFNKTRQTWLLHHMFDSVKVSDDHFEVLLLYLDGVRGNARDTTLKKAEAIVRWEGQGEEADTADAEKKQLRAKRVVQML